MGKGLFRKILFALAGALICAAAFALFPSAALADEDTAEITQVETTTEEITTEPEIQQALGIADDTSITFENTETENAIQQAVDMALSNADGALDIKTVTIVVGEGTYTNGLTIDKDAGGYTLADDFVLEIIAEDAKGADGSLDHSAGGSKMDGTIKIVGIDVLLAGLYLVGDGMVKAKDANVEYYGTEEDDTLNVTLEDGAQANIDTGDGNDEVTLSGESGGGALTDADITVDLGEGDDLITVDTSLAEDSDTQVNVAIDGGEGQDKLELTGSLNSGSASTASQDASGAAISLETESGNSLNISTVNTEAHTDTLENKNTVSLSGSGNHNIAVAQNLTDYMISNYTTGNLSVTMPSVPFLSNLIIDDSSLTINDITAAGLNIIIRGEDITVDGIVTGRNITIEAKDTDVWFDFSQSFGGGIIPDVNIQFSLFDFYTNANININASAQLIALETIKLTAKSEQTQPLMPDPSVIQQTVSDLRDAANAISDPNDPQIQQLNDQADFLESMLVNPNFVNVKVGNAKITILGSLSAISGVSIASSALVRMEVSNEDLAALYVPLCASLAVTTADVSLSGNAWILSALGSACLSACSDIIMKAAAITGKIPFALALSIVTSDAEISMADDTYINTPTGKTKMHTSGSVKVETTAINEVPEEDPADPNTNASGGYIALSIVLQDVGISVTGNASITAAAIDMASEAIEDIVTKALSANDAEEVDEDGDGTVSEGEGSFTITDILNIVTSLFGVINDNSMVDTQAGDAIDEAGGEIEPEDTTPADPSDDDMGLADLFDEGMQGAAPSGSTTSQSQTQVAGALAITYAGNKNIINIDTLGGIISSGAIKIEAVSENTAVTVADCRPASETETASKPTTSIGVSIALAIIDNENSAYLSASQIECSDLSIIAETGKVSSTLQAYTGITESTNIGIAGAAAVHIVKAVSSAVLAADAEVGGGDISIKAEQESNFTTEAIGSSDGTDNPTAKVGIGAGIAIAIIGCEATAGINDGVEITMPSGVTEIGSIDISAAMKNEENAKSQAGAAGGIAIVPVLTLIVSGAQANAYMGAGSVPVVSSGDININSTQLSIRTADADADAGSNGSVGFGGAFLVDILNDGAEAQLKRSVKAENLGIYAESKSTFTGNAKASSSGATSNSDPATTQNTTEPDSGEGDADALADRNTESAAKLSGEVGTSNVNEGEISGLTANRQNAETSEGKISIAAAFALNIQNNDSNAYVADGLTIDISSANLNAGKASILSKNKTDGSISANASAVGSKGTKLGVGVAVAINIITYNNTATLGSSVLYANSLSIASTMCEEEEEDEDEEEEDHSLRGIIKQIVGQFVNDAISSLSFVEDFADEAENMITEIVDMILTELTAGTGIEGLLDGDIKELVFERLETIEGIAQGDIDNALTLIIDEMQTRLESLLSGGSTGTFDASTLNSALQEEAINIVNELTGELVDFNQLFTFLKGDILAAAKDKLNTIILNSGSIAVNTMLKILDGWIGTDAQELYGHTIYTEAIAGAGSSKIGIAGSAAITVLNALTKAEIAGNVSLAALPDIIVAGHTEILSDAVNVVKTVASSAVGADGKADENSDAESSANGDASGGDTPEDPSTQTPTEDPAPEDADPAVVSVPNTTEKSGASVGIGAAFALNYLNIESSSIIGENRNIETGTLAVKANVVNQAETVSVAGQDPLAGGGSQAKIAVDASVAVGLIFTDVNALVGAGTHIKALGGNTFDIAEPDAEGTDLEELLNTYIFASSKGSTITRASGFASGDTAVGAAVAVNIAESKVRAMFAADAELSGDIKVLAKTFNEDDATGIATAVGAKAQRYADKLNGGIEATEDQINAVADGSYADDGDTEGTGPSTNENKTQENINDKLEEHNNSEQDPSGSGEKTNDNASLSANIMKTQDASTEGNPDTSEGTNAAGESGTTPGLSGGQSQTQQSSKLRLAAALALNITDHESEAKLSGTITALAASVLSENNGNFQAAATGAAISLDNGNSIGLAFAISINENKSSAEAGGDIAAADDVNISAHLSQNLDGRYKGLLGAQAIGGAVSSGDAKICIAGAVAIIVSKADTSALLAGGADLTGNNVVIEAADKSKLAVRAGAISASKASVGMGVSFALIYAHNEINAEIESGTALDMTTVNARSLKVSARKLKVDFSDYSPTFDLGSLVSTEKKTDDTNSDESDEIYSVDISFDTDTIQNSINLLNFLSSTNYYAEAISGAIAGGQNKLALSGSFALVFFFNSTMAGIGDYVAIDMTSDIEVDAETTTTTRVIAGAVTVGQSKVGVGLTLGFIFNQDKTYAQIGSHTTMDTAGALSVSAKAALDMMLVTVAVAATTGTSIGGSISFIYTENDVQASIGEYSVVNAASGVDIAAANSTFMILFALSASGSTGQAAVGGTIALLITGNSAKATVGKDTHITATAGHVYITAEDAEELYAIMASLSGSSGGTSVAGTVSAQIARSKAEAILGDDVSIIARDDIKLCSLTDTWALAIMLAAAGGNNAVGASISANIFSRTAQSIVGLNGYIQSTNGSVIISSLARDFLLNAVVAGAGSSGVALSGNLPVVVGESTVRAEVNNGTEIRAKGSIAVAADLRSDVVVPALSLTVGSSASVGITAIVVLLKNIIEAIVGSKCTLYAGAAAPVEVRYGRRGLFQTVDPTRQIYGIVVQATGVENIVMFAVSGTAGGSAAVTGVINTLLLSNTVTAQIGRESETDTTTVETDGDVDVSADDEALIIDCAGGITVGSSAGVGATIVVVIFDRVLTAAIYDNVNIIDGSDSNTRAARNVTVRARTYDDMFLFTIAFAAGGSAGVAGDANAVIFMNTAKAIAGGNINADGSILVSSENSSLLVSMGVGMAGGGTAGVAAVAVITYFQSSALTEIHADAVINAKGTVTIRSKSHEIIISTGAGASGSGTASVTGTVGLIFVQITTKTTTGNNVQITGSSVSITADDDYYILGIMGSFAGSGVAGVGITALVAIAFSSVAVEIGLSNRITSTLTDINIEATSNRKFDAFLITCGVGGVAGVSVSVAVLIIGDSLIDDVKGLFYPEDDGEDNGHFEMQGTVDEMFTNKNVHGDAKSHRSDADMETRLNTSGKSANDYSADVDGSEDENDNGEFDDGEHQDGAGFAETEPDDDLTEEEQQQAAKDNATGDSDDYVNSINNSPNYNSSDAILVKVGAYSVLTSARDINIISSDDLQVDVITGAVAVGAYAGVGVCVSISVLMSNVVAKVEENARLCAVRDISLIANSGTTKFTPGSDSPTAKKNDLLGDSETENEDGTSYVSFGSRASDPSGDAMVYLADATARLITVSIGGAIAGVSVSVAALLVFTQTHAIMEGDVYTLEADGSHTAGARNLNVVANSQHGLVMNLTLTIAAGFVGVGAGISLSLYQSLIESCIASNAEVILSGAAAVYSVSDALVVAVATAMGGGVVAVNAGAAIAINLTRVDTFIGSGVRLSAQSVTVYSDITTRATAIILAVAIGAGAFNVTFASAILLPTVLTYIGATPVGTPLAHSQGIGGLIDVAGDIIIKNKAVGEAFTFTATLAAGAVAMNGAVALAFNYIIGYAAINKANVSAANITIIALLDGDARIETYGGSLGAIAGGLIVAIALIFSENVAMIDTTGSVIDASGTISLKTQDTTDPDFIRYESNADINIRTAGIGSALALSVNIAMALNKAENKAVVFGSGSLTAGSLSIMTDGWTQAKTDTRGLSVGTIAISITVSLAILLTYQEASLSGDGTYVLGSLTVISRQNYDKSTDSDDAVIIIKTGGGGLAYISGQIGIALADATGIAAAGAKSLTVTGDIDVQSLGRSKAKITLSDASAGVVTFGLVFGRAEAKGTFIAKIDATGAEINAEDVDISTTYSASAIIDIIPASGGVSVSIADLDFNIGIAKVSTTAYAAVIGSGDITFTGHFNITTTGAADADAIVRGAILSLSVINIAVNVVYATLSAVQAAYVQGMNLISTTAGSNVNIRSYYNITGTHRAKAIVGENNFDENSASVSYLDVQVNTAIALSASSVSAYISGGGINILGDLLVETQSNSNAYADIDSPTVAISYISIAANLTIANAAGAYQAYIDSTGSSIGISAHKITVLTNNFTNSHSVIGGSGSKFEGSAFSIKVNYAKANAYSESSAYLKGSGDITSETDITVQVIGDGLALATVKDAKVSVNLVSLRSNETIADFNAVQNAYMDIAGNVTARDGITVKSDFNTASGQTTEQLRNASSSSGNGCDGASFSFANVADSISKSRTQAINNAYIKGSGIITISAGSLNVLANTHTSAYSCIESGLSVSGMTFGGMQVYSYTSDSTNSYIDGEITIYAMGDASDVIVEANGETNSEVYVTRSGAVSLFSVNVVLGVAIVGYMKTDGTGLTYQNVSAYIGDNSTVEAGRNIKILAYNAGRPKTYIGLGTRFSGFNFTEVVTLTRSYYTTSAKVGSNSELRAGNDILIWAHCEASVSSTASASSYGFISVSDFYARNIVSQTVTAEVGAGSVLFARKDITIKASSFANIYAKTDITSGGLLGVTELTAKNELTRTLNTSIGANSTVESESGDISIISMASSNSKSGATDSIRTIGEGDGAGLVGVAEGEIYTSILSNSNTTVAAGAKVKSTFGIVTIAAYTGIGYLYAKLDMDAGGLGASTNGKNYVTNLELNAKTTIGSDGGAQAEIEGEYVNIYALMDKLNVNLYEVTTVSGFGCSGKAYGYLYIFSLVLVDIYDSIIKAYDRANIMAMLRPAGGISIYTHATINAFAGSVSAYSYFFDYSTGVVKIHDNADIYGAYVNIDASDFYCTIYMHADGTRRAIASKYTGKAWYKYPYFGYPSRTSIEIDSDVDFYIGDAAAGIAILIDEDGNIYTVGLKDSSIVSKSGSTVTIKDIVNAAPGILVVDGSLGGADVYTQEYIPYIRIINKSLLNLEMGGADLHNDSYANPTVHAQAGTYHIVSTPADEIPEEGLSITSYQGTDVTLGCTGGIIFNEIRTTTIEWVDEDPTDAEPMSGNLYSNDSLFAGIPVATLWTHELNIINAANVGESETNRFTVYLTVKDGEAPDISLNASGSVYISIALADIKMVDALPSVMDTTPIGTELLLKEIIAAGVLDILLPLDVRINYLGGTTGIMLIFPGMVKYTDEWYVISGQTSFGDLGKYQSGFNPVDGTLGYVLPDGTEIYTDENGAIIRIIEKAKVIEDPQNYEEAIAGIHNLANFSISANGLIFRIENEGITLDLTTGLLTVEDDGNGETNVEFAPYLIYTGSANATGLAYVDFNGNWQIVDVARIEVERILQLFTLTDQDVSGDTVTIKTDYTLMDELTYWKTEEGIGHYLVFNSLNDIHNFNFGHLNVLMIDGAKEDAKIVGAYVTTWADMTLVSGSAGFGIQKVLNFEFYTYNVATFGSDTITAVFFAIKDGDGNYIDYKYYFYYDFAFPIVDSVNIAAIQLYVDSANTNVEWMTLDTTNLEALLAPGLSQGYAPAIRQFFRGWAYTSGLGAETMIIRTWSEIDYLDKETKELTYYDQTAGEEAKLEFTGYDFGDGVYIHDETKIKYFANDVTTDFYLADLVTTDTVIDESSVPQRPYPAMVYKKSPTTVDVEYLMGANVHLGEGDSITLLKMAASVNGTTVYGYVLTDSLFIGEDGTVYFDYTLESGSPVLNGCTTYNPKNGGRYEDGAVIVQNTDDISAATVTIKAGIDIRYEMMTSDVAVDCTGTYYRHDGSAWVQTTVGVFTSGTKITEISSKCFDAAWLAANGLSITKVLEVYAANGTDVMITIITMSDGLRYYLLNKDGAEVLLGEDGTVKVLGTGASVKKAELEYQDYLTGYMEGSTVIIRMEDPNGDILDDNNSPTDSDDDDAAGASIDIRAAERVVFMTESAGTIGLVDNKIDIVSPIIDYYDLAGNDIVYTDTYLTVMGNSVINDGAPIIIRGAVFQVISTDGDLYYGKIEVEPNAANEGASLILNVENGRILPTNMHADPAIAAVNGEITVTDSTASLTASGDIVINHFTASGCTAFDIVSTGADVLSYSDNTDSLPEGYFTMDDSHVTITAYGDYEYNTLQITGGTVFEATAQNGSIVAMGTDSIISSIASQITLTAADDIEYNIIELSSLSGLTATAQNGSVTLYDGDSYINMDDSTANITAYANIEYNAIDMANSSTMTATAQNGSVTLYDGDSYINMDESTADITAYANIEYNAIDMTNSSTMNATAQNGSVTLFDGDSYINMNDSNAAITAYADIEHNSIDMNTSVLTAEATNGYFSLVDEFSYINIIDSELYITAGLDIIYNLVDAAQSTLEMRSTGGNIFPLNSDSRIIITGDTSAVVMSALYDIAYSGMHMLLDIPEAVTLYIEHVEDYWIDAVGFPLAVYLLPPVYEGIDENGEDIANDGPVWNEYLGNIIVENITAEYDDILDSEWAELIIGEMTRAQWLAIVTSGSVEQLIQDEKIDAAWLSEWLEDDTITEEVVTNHLTALRDLAPGDADYDNAEIWLNDMETQMRQAIVDKESPLPPVDPADPEPLTITDEMAADILALFINANDLGTIDDPHNMISAEGWDEFIENVAARIKELMLTTPNPDGSNPKDIYIDVTESTGTAWVTNEGSIYITQHTGDMTLDLIDSARENVALESLGGSILSIPSPGRAVIEAWDISLSAADSIGSLTQAIYTDQMTNEAIIVANVLDEYLDLENIEVTPDDPATEANERIDYIKAILTASTRFDWIRLYDEFAPTNLEAAAGTGSIYIQEVNGALGLNNISAGTDVNIWAQSVQDTRPEADLSNIITAGGNVMIEVQEGGIGTVDDYFNTEVGGNIVIIAPDDIFITDTLDMNLTVTTTGNVNAEAQDNLILANTAGDLLLGYVYAGGLAEITSQGDITEGDRHGHPVTVEAEAITFIANGIIGTYENPFEINIGAGDLNVDAAQLVAYELDGGININHVNVSGDVKLRAPGQITSNDSTIWNDAAYWQWEANFARTDADAAQTTADLLQEEADKVRAPADAADKSLQDAQDDLDDAQQRKADLEAQLLTETDPDEIDRLNEEIAAVDDEIAELEAKRDAAAQNAANVHSRLDSDIAAAQAKADAAQLDADMWRADADFLQFIADQLLSVAMSMGETMIVGGNLQIDAGAGVGEFYNNLSMSVGGSVNINGGTGGVYIAGNSPFSLKSIRAQSDVMIVSTTGEIQEAAGCAYPCITGDWLYIFALARSDIGRVYNYMDVMINGLEASGENVYINNLNATAIGQLDANGDAMLSSGGAVTVGYLGGGYVRGNNVEIGAGGNIGTGRNNIVINSPNITLRGADIDIQLVSYFVNLGETKGKTITIKALGNIRGGIVYAKNLRIFADGNIGYEEDPLMIYVSHIIMLRSAMGQIFFINLYPFLNQWLSRRLESHYLAVYALTIPFYITGIDEGQTLFMLIGLKEDGRWDILGFWTFADGSTYDDIVKNLSDRGVEQIDVLFLGASGTFEEAFRALFPDVVICVSTYLWELNRMMDSETDDDYYAMMSALRSIYEAGTLEEAKQLYDEYMDAWQGIYPETAQHLEDNWQAYEDSFDDMAAMREVGFKFKHLQDMTEAMMRAVKRKGTYYNMDCLYQAMFDIMVQYFPQYKSEQIV